MSDPYLYENTDVLKNKLNIRDNTLLNKLESDYVNLALFDVKPAFDKNNFDFETLKSVHKHLFSEVYEWAGQIRTVPLYKAEEVLSGKSVIYSEPKHIEQEATKAIANFNAVSWSEMAKDDQIKELAAKTCALWQVHPFREGNTRTVLTYVLKLAEFRGIQLDREHLKVNAAYVRNALVMGSLGQYSEPKYIQLVFKNCMYENQLQNDKNKSLTSNRNDYKSDKKMNNDRER